MTFDELKVDIRELLETSNVNLGRKTAKTRQGLIESIMSKVEIFGSTNTYEPIVEKKEEEKDSGRLLCLKPSDRRAALNMGKGVHAMTPDQSQVADQQLGRSPYPKGEKNE